jgi:hypothetical protein
MEDREAASRWCDSAEGGDGDGALRGLPYGWGEEKLGAKMVREDCIQGLASFYRALWWEVRRWR